MNTSQTKELLKLELTHRNPDSPLAVTWHNGVYLGKFMKTDDGLYCFDPEVNGGLWTQSCLKALADKLKELNDPIEKEMIDFFEKRFNETK